MVKISVVIPVYNASEYLDESIGSLINQTFEDFELICVNDGSKDDSLKILNKFAEKDDRVKVIDQENGGCGAARNRALDEATGDFIYFFDPDDYILDNTLEKLYTNAIRNNSDIVLFKIARFRDNEPIIYSLPGFDFEKDFEKTVDFDNASFDYHSVKRHVLNTAFAPWTKLYRREFLEAYDDFRFPLRIPFDDVPFHVKAMLRAKKISFVPEYLYFYRLSNPNSINNTSSNGIFIMDIVDMVEEYLKESGHFEEFLHEFYLFKVIQILCYIINSNSEEYFQRAKLELLKVKEEFFDKGLNDNDTIAYFHVDNYEMIIYSDSFSEYKLKRNAYYLKNESRKLKRKQKKLKKRNKNLKNKNKKLTKENKKLKKDVNKLKRFNKSLLNSNSWKITKILRKIKNP